MAVDLEMLQYTQPANDVLAALEQACVEHESIKRLKRNEDLIEFDFKTPLIKPGGCHWSLRAEALLSGCVVTASVPLVISRTSVAADRFQVQRMLAQTAFQLAGPMRGVVPSPLVDPPKVADKHATQLERMLAELAHAEEAVADGDVVAEELAVWRAERTPTIGAFSLQEWIKAEVDARRQAGKLRRRVAVLAEFGEEGSVMSDRVRHHRQDRELSTTTFRPLDADVRASVEEGDSSTGLGKPSFTQAAVRSVRPRRAALVLTHPEWLLTFRIDPAAMDRVNSLVEGINATFGAPDLAEGTAVPSSNGTGGVVPTVAGQLRELAGLHRDGALTDDEFTNAKAKLLDA